MRIVVGVIGAFLVFIILLDAFETIILPRRVTRALRPARMLIRSFWRTWAPLSGHIRSEKTRESYLSYFGPLALLVLFAFWGAMLVAAFGLLQWAAGSAMIQSGAHGGASTFPHRPVFQRHDIFPHFAQAWVTWCPRRRRRASW